MLADVSVILAYFLCAPPSYVRLSLFFIFTDFSALAYRKSRFTDPDRDTAIFKKPSWNDNRVNKIFVFFVTRIYFLRREEYFLNFEYSEHYFLMLFVMSNQPVN